MLKMFIYKFVHSVLSDTNTSSPLAHCTSGSGSSFWEWAYSYFFFLPNIIWLLQKRLWSSPERKSPGLWFITLRVFCCCFVCLVFINGYHLLKLKNIFCSPPKKFTNLCWVPNLTLCNPIKLKCKATTTKAHFEPQRPIFSSCTSSSRELHYLTNK